MGNMIRILLVEDHHVLREALAQMLEREPAFTVVGQAGTLAEAREMLRDIDVAIIDLGLPDGEGSDLIADLREANPRREGAPKPMALVLTASFDHLDMARAVEAGAAGILHKTVAVNEVVDAVHRLWEGEPLLSTAEIIELMGFAIRRREQNRTARLAMQSLTPREREVLQALAAGLNNRGIADRLGIAVETERNYMTSVLAKLGVNSRLQALVFAVRHGLVDIHSEQYPSEEE